MPEKYRKCVGIVVCNNDKKVLLCERNDIPNQWQFPQGGIEKNETLLEAAYRELREETSIVSIKKFAVLEGPFRYDFPPLVKAKFKHVGQEVSWVFLEFVGSDDEINLDTDYPEFDDWKWADIDEALVNIVDFKSDVYKKAVDFFKSVVK